MAPNILKVLRFDDTYPPKCSLSPNSLLLGNYSHLKVTPLQRP